MFRVGMWGLATLMTALVLSGCTNKGRLAPFDDHSIGAARSSNRVLPGAENAGKPGYYTVKPGDTLIRIGMDNGQSGRDIARWNKLDNPNLIETGQVLRVVPPGSEAPIARASAATGSAAAPMPVASAPAAAAPIPAPTAAEDAISFQWPARGNLISGFDESKNKGLDIGGKAGDPVLAAADGRVVYAGAGLRGYGNLIILKHNNTYLTAYAHNQALLVKEDQVIKRGQKIAEMGNSDADQVKLHFEIRRQGKPVDPAKYLAAN
jgi:lipoprotein NlpD